MTHHKDHPLHFGSGCDEFPTAPNTDYGGPRLRRTHTYAEMEISPAAFDEIAEKLKDAGYGHAFIREEGCWPTLDMHGIGLVRGADTAAEVRIAPSMAERLVPRFDHPIERYDNMKAEPPPLHFDGPRSMADSQTFANAVMQLAAAVASIDLLYAAENGPAIAYAPTGEGYVTLMVGGVKPEGEVVPIWCYTATDAVREWVASFYEYTRGRKGRLYWRWRPQVICEGGHYQVCARLLITDKPVDPDFTNRTGRYELVPA
jgi:hypothetical protein